MKKALILLLLFSFPVIILSESQEAPDTRIEIPSFQHPQDFNEARDWGQRFVDTMPHETEKAWDEALSIWKKTYQSTSFFWKKHLKQRTINIWNKVWGKSKQKIEDQVEKEKETVKQRIKNFWQGIVRSILGG
jgi:predicted flavoprotein YhiN